MSDNNKLELAKINTEINDQLKDEKVAKALLVTTFKGLEPVVMKQALFEGMMRGFTFKDFLEKNVYAIPFGGKYSLITSIDFARKIAMRSGLAGKSEPRFEYGDDKKIISCTITVKRNADGVVGDYTATVFFSEFSTSKNLWTSKPHVMIAKVAEMHALRSAFPEEMAKQYVEEEMEKTEFIEVVAPKQEISEELIAQVKATTNIKDLAVIYKKNEGLGKGFAKLVTEQKAFIKSVNDTEKNDGKA